MKGWYFQFPTTDQNQGDGAKNQASVLTFRIQGYACDCNLELDHFKEMLKLGSSDICKLLPKCGFIMYSERLKVPYLIN